MSKQKTVQNQTSKVTQQILEAKIEGMTIEFLETLDLQQLQTIADNAVNIKKEPSNKNSKSIATDVLSHCIKNNIESLTFAQLRDLVRGFNLGNYFNLPNDFKFTTVEMAKTLILLNHIKSSNADKSNAERQTLWLKRAKNYINSHLISTSDTASGTLFNNKDVNHYFTKSDGNYILTEKVA